MNHHDIRLIEIGQKEVYAKAVREIVAWSLRRSGVSCLVMGGFLKITPNAADRQQKHWN